MACLTPECNEEKIFSRGLCSKCYQRLKKRVARGTIRWHDLIDQGLAKRASRMGPSSDARRAAQPAGNSRKSRGNPYGLSDVLWKAAIESARSKLANLEELTEEERLRYNGILSLAGDGDDI
jgi:hypothetical protein